MAEFKQKDMTGSAWLARDKESGEIKLTSNGKEYFKGDCTIGGKKYFVNVFDNRQDKKHPNGPDFSFMFTEPKWQSKGVNPVSQIRSNSTEDNIPF